LPFHSTLYNNENLLRKNTSKTKRKLIAYFHNARATTRVAHINVKPLSYILAAKRNAIFFTRSQKELIHSSIRNFVFDIPQCGVSANPVYATRSAVSCFRCVLLFCTVTCNNMLKKTSLVLNSRFLFCVHKSCYNNCNESRSLFVRLLVFSH